MCDNEPIGFPCHYDWMECPCEMCADRRELENDMRDQMIKELNRLMPPEVGQ